MNPSNGQAPLDYLNQIAPQAPKKSAFELSLGKVIIIGVILIVFVIVLSLVLNTASSSGKEPWQRLSARLETTTTLANDARLNIKSSKLRSLNSDLTLYLTNTTRDLSKIIETKEIQLAKTPTSIINEESGDAVAGELEDARLNNIYDMTYAREMSYQLSRVIALLEAIAKTASGSDKDFLQTAHNNLLPIYTSIQAYSTES